MFNRIMRMKKLSDNMNGKQFKEIAKGIRDEAEVSIGENPKALLIIDRMICTMIKLDGDWDRE